MVIAKVSVFTGRWQKDDLFIPNHQMQRVMHGDFVLAQPAGLDRRGRREVRIVRVLESRKNKLWVVFLRKRFWLCSA